jgi:hypothetical protein
MQLYAGLDTSGRSPAHPKPPAAMAQVLLYSSGVCHQPDQESAMSDKKTQKLSLNRETVKNLKTKTSIKAGKATVSVGCTDGCIVGEFS